MLEGANDGMRWRLLVLVGVFLLGVTVGAGLSPEAETVPEQARTESAALKFTTLVCRELVCYDSPYAGEETVTGVTALAVTNTGSVGIRYACIRCTRGGQELCFEFEYIPAGATAVAPEQTGALWEPGEMENCRCVTVLPAVLDESGVTVEAGEDGLLVTNTTDTAIACVRLHYKYYDAGGAVFLGAAQQTEIYDLRPGETRRVTPEFYNPGTSAVVAVEAE